MKQTYKIPIEYEQAFFTNALEQYDHVILALHGYQQSGEFFYKRLEKHLDLSKTLVICPNGPFLLPTKKNNAWIDTYSWYFFDPLKKSFYINYEPSAKLVSQLLDQINVLKKDVTLIGYSQGGYLSPKVAQYNPSIRKVIGMACIFRGERFELKEDCSYFQIHGTKDDVVSLDEAKEEFDQLNLPQVNFSTIDADHLLTSNFFEKLKTYL